MNSTSTELPEEVPSSQLLHILESIPASFKEQGIWFNDYARALAIAGAPQPRSLEEFLSHTEPGRANEYINALRGLGCNSGLWLRAKQTEDWNATFGFDVFDVDREVTTGRVCQDSLQSVYFEGVFDASTIQQRLLDLGYREESASGSTYYAVRDDREQPDPQADPTVRAASSLLNRVFVSDGNLVATPSTGPMVEVLAVAAGESPSLADDPIFSSLAASLGDPLSAAILTRQMVLEPEGDIEPVPAVQREKPEDWGSLHQWEAVGIGYSISEGQHWWTFSLFYPIPEGTSLDAEEKQRTIQLLAADTEELISRMEGYTTTLPQLLDGRPLGEVCGPFNSNHISGESGSVLTVRCPVRDESVLGLRGLWGMVAAFDLGFLLP